MKYFIPTTYAWDIITDPKTGDVVVFKTFQACWDFVASKNDIANLETFFVEQINEEELKELDIEFDGVIIE